MEPFKIALKIAIDQQADKISFVEGRLPVMWKGDKEIAMNHQPIVQKILLSQLFASFFPSHQDKLIEGQPVQGPLKVVDVGDLILLAIPGKPAALNVYFPGAGEQFFADDWRSLARVRNSGPAVEVASPDASAEANPSPAGEANPSPAGEANDGPSAVPPPPPVAHADFQPRPSREDRGGYQAEPVAPTLPLVPIPRPDVADQEQDTADQELDAADREFDGRAPGPAVSVDNTTDSSEDQSEMNSENNDDQAAREAAIKDKLATTSDPNINFDHTQDFSSLEVSQLRPIPRESFAKPTPTSARAKPAAGPVKIDGKDITALLTLMSQEGFDKLVLTSEHKAAFWNRRGMTLSDTALTATAVNIAIETLFPEASPKGAPSIFHRWHKPTGGDGFRLHGSFGEGKPWLSVTRKVDPLSQTTGELLIPEGITDLAALERGLIIIAGEQGSGRSTTAHQLVDRINHQRSRNILILTAEPEAEHRPERSCIRSLCANHWTEGTLSSLASDPADTVIIDGEFDTRLIEPVLLALSQGKLVCWIMSGQTAHGALFDGLAQLGSPRHEPIKLLSHLQALVSQSLVTSHDHQAVPLFEARRLSDRHRHLLMDQWPHQRGKNADALFELLGPATAPGISFEKSILSAIALGAITPCALKAQFFDQPRLDRLFADSGISSATEDLLTEAS